jgi:TRAP-type C4-dicarboxylate transport system permease small subunit
MSASVPPDHPAPDPLSGAGRLLRTLDAVVGRLAKAMAVVGALVVLGLTALVGYSVFWRYVLGQPITWTDELSGYLVVLLVMLGVGEALRRGDHINVDLLIARMGPAGRRWSAVWGMAAVIAVGVVLLISGIEAVRFSYAMGMLSEGYLEVPMWIPQSAILLGAVMLLASAGTAMIRALAGYRADDGTPH